MKTLIEEYQDKFNESPITIGLYWQRPDIVITNVLRAIEDNKPYNEYDLLSKEEQKAFDKGELVF